MNIFIKQAVERAKYREIAGALESGEISKSEARRRLEEDDRAELDEDRPRSVYPDLAERLARDGFRKSKRPVYLRFGELPAGGRSASAGIREDGVSCFAGRLTKGGHYVVSVTHEWQLPEFVRLCRLQDRPAFFLRGKVCGRGDANEPLLKSIGSVEPVPDSCVVAVPGGSLSLDRWNERRIGGQLQSVPELERYFEESA